MTIGSTRISAQAGAVIDISAFLAGDLLESKAYILVNNLAWTYGTGANQINLIYQNQETLADDGTITLDLYASGTLLDIWGRALTMTALKLLYIKNNSTDATLKLFGGAATDLPVMATTNDIMNIKPGGEFLWTDPSAAGTVITTNKNLKLLHGGQGSSNMNVDIIAMGLD